jgi:AcrR family transcriptional regulator
MPKQTFFNLPEDKRQQILDIAIDEFAEKDYRSVSITHIVDKAGIAKGSFYQYFEDKRDLFLHLLEIASQEKLIYLQKSEPPSPEMGIFTYIHWLVQVGSRFQFSNPRLAQIGYKALYSDFPFKDEGLRQLKKAGLDYYRQLIQQGKQQGDINPEINSDAAVFVLSTIFNELGNYLIQKLEAEPGKLTGMEFFEKEKETIEKMTAEVLGILQYGMCNKEKKQ